MSMFIAGAIAAPITCVVISWAQAKAERWAYRRDAAK